MKLYKTLIRPGVTFAAETLISNICDENVLRIFERKIIRVRTNPDISNLLQAEYIMRDAKFLRLSWRDHVERMDSERTRNVY
jgi:hypothetical protein